MTRTPHVFALNVAAPSTSVLRDVVLRVAVLLVGIRHFAVLRVFALHVAVLCRTTSLC
jgi:hypothetical protein